MANQRRRPKGRRPPATGEPGTSGSDDFIGQIGLFETGNGSPFGPFEIVLAIIAAVLIYPITRLAGRLRRR